MCVLLTIYRVDERHVPFSVALDPHQVQVRPERKLFLSLFRCLSLRWDLQLIEQHCRQELSHPGRPTLIRMFRREQ